MEIGSSATADRDSHDVLPKARDLTLNTGVTCHRTATIMFDGRLLR